MATNDFLTFAGDPAADVMAQADYVASGFTARLLGFSTGTALSIQLNKVWRQASLISHMIGQFTVDEISQDMLDDGTPGGVSALQSHFRAAVTHVAQGAIGVGYLPLIGGTLTGPLTINAPTGLAINAPASTSAAMNLGRQAGFAAQFVSYTGANQRWAILLANADPEQGSNTGSDFSILSYTDGGLPLDTPLFINRATGVVNFSHAPTLNGSSLPYLPTVGGNLTGPLGVGSSGINYPAMGGNWAAHRTAFGWDGSFIIGAVDGAYIGQLATVGWTQSLTGNYLPLSGGQVAWLTVSTNLTIYGNTAHAGYTSFANLGDFGNFWDGRYRYRQWASSWYDAWDGATGLRAWSNNVAWIMQLDGPGNLTLQGTVNVNGGRLSSRNSTNQSVTPSVSVWNIPAGVAKGFWVDNSGLWFGNTDAGGNPIRTDALFDNNGYCTFYSSVQINGGLWVPGSIASPNLTLYNDLWCHGSASVDHTFTVYGTIWAADTVSSNTNVFANQRMIAQSGYPAYCSYNNVFGAAGGFYAVAESLQFTQMDGAGNPIRQMATMFYNGWLYMNGGVGTASDAKVKSDIASSKPFDSLAALRGLVSRAFNWNSDGRHQPFGLIAQEVRAHLPDAVHHHDDTDYLDLTTLIVHLIRAVQQLSDRLEERVAA